MTLRHYHIFVTVCDTMNMTAAAQLLYMSQPAVSQAIAELERHYGVQLFERLSRKLYLTAAGDRLLGYARHILRMNTEAETEMQALDHDSPIRIGASVTVGTCVLPQLAVHFRALRPAARLEVLENNTAQIENAILHDRVDLGLVEGETASADLVSRAFLNDELLLICSPQHRFAACSAVAPAELAQEALILREPGSGTRRLLEERLAEHGLPCHAAWTCSNTEAIKNAVAAGLGVSVISARAAKAEVHAGVLCQRPVAGISFQRTFRVIYHKNKYLTNSMQAFLTLLQTHKSPSSEQAEDELSEI